MRANRNAKGYIINSFTPKKREELATASNVVDELFGILEYISEIEEKGIELIKSAEKTTKHKECFLSLQAYIRQAKTYFYSAQSLHFRASPLNYYYAFMNLAKAFLILSSPNETIKKEKGKWYHGLKYKTSSSKLFDQFIKTDNGVFTDFYYNVTKNKFKRGSKINIKRLLSYCTDISHEYQSTTKEMTAIAAGMCGLCFDAKDNKWSILAITNFNKFKKYNKTMKAFWKYFEEVDFKKESAHQIFGLDAWEKYQFSFFESRKIYDKSDTELIKEALSAVENLRESIPYKGKLTFFFCEPYRVNLQKPFNEMLAVYSIMYFLSSLVRYQPKYLEDLLSTNDLWLIERFIKNTPITFLRHITNLILDIDYIMSQR